MVCAIRRAESGSPGEVDRSENLPVGPPDAQYVRWRGIAPVEASGVFGRMGQMRRGVRLASGTDWPHRHAGGHARSGHTATTPSIAASAGKAILRTIRCEEFRAAITYARRNAIHTIAATNTFKRDDMRKSGIVPLRMPLLLEQKGTIPEPGSF